MAMEPITIYARRSDPRGVLELLRSLDPDVQVVGSDEAWETITLLVRQPGKKQPLRLSFRHDPDYYDGPGWDRQMLGMRGYFIAFPENSRTERTLQMIGSFRFALATEWEPDLIPEGDSRLPYLYAVAAHLDGALFTLSTLRDAEGRILYGADGDFDEDAVFPTLPPPAPADPDEEDAEDEEGEDGDYRVQTPERVARRALVLCAVTVRALLEQDDPSDPGTEEFRRRILDWIEALSLQDEIEPDEWEVLQRPVGRLEHQQQINATWRLEGLGILAWALNRFELPPHDQLVNPNDLVRSLGFLNEEASRSLLAEPQLRPESELTWMGQRLLGLHWRFRDFTLRPVPMDFSAFARNCWFGSFDIQGIRLLDQDLALGEKPLAQAGEEAFNTAYSTAGERHLAINWLRGFSRIYSQTDTST